MLGSARSVLMKQRVPAFPAPIAAYALNENTGTTSVDSSGNGHHLTLNGTSWATGHTGSGLTNATMTLGARAAFAAPAAITVMAWIRPLDLTPGTTHIGLGFVDTGGNTDIGIFTQRGDFGPSDVLQCDLRINGNLAAFNGGTISVGTWVHVAITYNGSTVELYKNGISVVSTPASGGLSPSDAFYVAGGSSVSLYDTNVVVDDVRIFNTALTLTQVNAAMTTPVI